MEIQELVKQKMARSKKVKTISLTEINEFQKFYDDNHTLNDCAKQFGYCRHTLMKYLTTRPRTKLQAEQKKQQNVKSVVSWRQRTKQKLVDYKGGKCKVCGYNRYIGSLVFHHLNPLEKDFSITAKTISFEKLKAEVDKCELVCSNCHGEIHAGLIVL
jgi:hypothetical protein